MKLSASVLVLGALLVAGHADAEPLAISKQYETDKKFGVGVALGVPVGGVGKFLITPKFAIDFGAGGYYLYRDRDGIHLYGDILWHPFVAVEGETFLAPLYVGLGSRILNYDDITHFGLRVPVGVSFDFYDAAIDVFLEGAFIYDVSIGEGGEGAVDVNGQVGLRYYIF